MDARFSRPLAEGASYENGPIPYGSIANLIKVPRERDFGIDFFCQRRIAATGRLGSVIGAYALQIRSGKSPSNTSHETSV